MRKSYRFLAASLIASLFSVVVFAQTITLTGTVRNSSSKEVVPAVSVVVKGTSLGTYTNSNGEFSIKVVKLPVVLVFTSINYDINEVTVNDASTPISVDFKPNTTMGTEVVVAATRTPTRIMESPVTIERMGPSTLHTLAAPNYYEAIANLKGVDMHTASLTFRTVTTRGFVSSGNTKLNQLVDGMDNQAPGLNFSVGSVIGPSELDLDNVELLSGASSALYGSGGMNGTLLITSKNPFKYQGLSVNIKQGIMHVDNRQRSAAPYYNWDFRWAKAFSDKFAFKLAFSFIKGSDWQAEDYRDKQQIGILSKVVGGNRSNDPAFNGVNIYGDETAANMGQLAALIRDGINGGVLSATGGLLNLMTVANGFYGTPTNPGALGNPLYPTNAQNTQFITFLTSLLPPGTPPAQVAAIQQAAGSFLPYYTGVKNGYFPTGANVSRTGYEEKYLVDYNATNFKFNGGLHYKITPNLEASWNSYIGAGTTVYTGADRYSLRNLKIAQHKLEFKGKSWFLRGYTTQENAGDSYNATALGTFINEAWKPSLNTANLGGSWFPQYIGTFSEGRRTSGSGVSDIQLHQAARAAADVGRLLPGTSGFETAANQIKSTPIKKGGALFLDRSDLWSAEGQLNLSDVLEFTDKIEVITGVQWKQWVMNSQGTIFADTLGHIKVNEVGGYAQLRKRLFHETLILTAAGRYDKQTNFDGRFTPRFTATIKVAKDNNIRLSYQTAYRFPTNQDQYISLVTGAGTLIGCLPQFQDYYKLSTTLPGYTPESVLAYRASNNPAATNLLVKAVYNPVKPESVSSYEIGYRGIIQKKLLVDGYLYYSKYKDFLATIGVAQSKTGNAQEVFSPFTTTNVSYHQNSKETVSAVGWGIGAEYQFIRGFNFYGNVYFDQLQNVPEGFVSFFNAPKYRWNLGLRNDNVYHNIGFNVVVKWQDNNFYEGTFVSGELPYFTWVDAQITYRPSRSKSTWRIGGSNIGNSYYRTGYGSPAVGGVYYISFGYNIF
ncbi:MAG TPA: TonB-dependent receptor [Chitinophagaceae bacterium]|nr:TonB-dependent receptor [Chitinophagaceae bacterium]